MAGCCRLKSNIHWTVNITWKQVIDLGRRVTRADQGVRYIGLAPGSPQSLSRGIATMASEEAQRAMNRGTRLTVLSNAELRSEFAMDTKLYEGGNL